MELRAKRVVVMGLGRFGGGLGAARFAVAQGADVLVTDLAPPRRLADGADGLAQLERLGVELRLGEHRVDDFAGADVVVVNPAVDPRRNRFLLAAEASGAKCTSEIQLLAARLPSRQRTIGVTGTCGKSTATAMIGHVLARAVGLRRVHVGGNLGGSLLGRLDAIEPDHHVVLELSSFMLEVLDRDAWSPGIALVTNIAPNHLDRHGTMERYIAAKRVILKHQRPTDAAVLGSTVSDWPVNEGVVRRVVEERDEALELSVPGRHNRYNARCAIAVSAAVGAAHRAADDLREFPGLAHRLQLVGEPGSIRCFNDSKSTTPGSTCLALESFEAGRVHAILGGYDKRVDLGPLCALAARHCRAVYTIGATGPDIAAACEGGAARVVPCDTLANAVKAAQHSLRPGDILLLSPGCASWDQFTNYEQRGDAFVEAIERLGSKNASSQVVE